MKEVDWTDAARKALKRADRVLAQRIVHAVERLAEHGHGDVKKLKGSEELRLRVGDWRVRFRDEGETLVIEKSNDVELSRLPRVGERSLVALNRRRCPLRQRT